MLPKLVFPQTTYDDTQGTLQQYLIGQLDADDIIEALDEAMVK